MNRKLSIGRCVFLRRGWLSVLFAGMALCSAAQSEERPEDVPQTQTPLPVTGVVPKFGYLNYAAVLETMPDYALKKKESETLRSQFQAEIDRMTDEFNRKYEEFLDGRDSFPKTILQKRQSELESLMNALKKFKADGETEMKKADEALMAQLRQKLDAAIKAVGEKNGYPFIINTENNLCPFVNPANGVDITRQVKDSFR